MSALDVARMAFHNLWSRKLRTTLNILGVVLACVVLMLTLAGTKGVSNGFQEMIRNSDEVRKFMIQRSWQPDVEVPEDVIHVEGEMSDERRERLRKRLKNQWLQENADEVALAGEKLQQLENLEHMQDVIPLTNLSCTISLGDVSETASIVGAARDRNADVRVLAGRLLEPTDHQGILVGEFAAYRLGYASDDQLQDLVGKEIGVSIRVGGHRMAYFLELMNEDDGAISAKADTLLALKRLMDSIDTTSLSDDERQLIRSAFSPDQPKASEPLFLEEKYVVRGVVREATVDDGWSFLQIVHVNTGSDIFMTSRRAAKIRMDMEGFETFWGATGIVDSVDHLESLTTEVEKLGLDTHSARRIVKVIDDEIVKAKFVISILCLLILGISAIGISNTMVVSVLERTSEFGILKALGARDRTVLQLMLMEGALTGLLGAVVAIVLSLSIAQVVAVFVQRYVTGRIGEQFDASVFAFSPSDLILVLAGTLRVPSV